MVSTKKRMRPADGILHITPQQYSQIRGALDTYETGGDSYRYEMFLEGWLTSQGWDADSFKYKPLEIRVHNMPWNYETGREEAAPYVGNKFGPSQGVGGTASPTTAGLKRSWEASEALLKFSPWQGLYQIQATKAFLDLELSMNTGDISKTEQSRKDYIAWLTAGKPTTPPPVSQQDALDSLGTVGKIINEGYRSLSKKAHPDAGGTAANFHELQKAKKVLDRVMHEIKDIL